MLCDFWKYFFLQNQGANYTEICKKFDCNLMQSLNFEKFKLNCFIKKKYFLFSFCLEI
jgi:hypothetical protein